MIWGFMGFQRPLPTRDYVVQIEPFYEDWSLDAKLRVKSFASPFATELHR